jgi:HlyD family secretion protein
MRRFALALGVIAVGSLVYVIGGPAWRGDGLPRYVVTPVDRGPIVATVTATGTVNPVTTVQVGTYVSGPIQEIFVDFNTPVRRGQRLATIDPRPFQVKVDDARAAVANARARLERDRADAALKALNLERTRELRERGIVSESDHDVALTQHRQARAQVALDEAEILSAEARLREAEVNLAYTAIASPVDGVVVARNVDVGQTVAATFQTPTLFLVAEDLAKMRVSVSVSESDIGAVAPGQEVAFTVDAYPASTFRGVVEQVRNSPVTVLNVVTYDVIVGVENQDLRLKPGMTANVTITTARRDDAVRIRTSALRFRPPAVADGAGAAAAVHETGRRVFVLDSDGAARAVPVETGIADDRFTEVTRGVAPGDRVITALRRTAPPAPSAPLPFGAAGGRRSR